MYKAGNRIERDPVLAAPVNNPKSLLTTALLIIIGYLAINREVY